MLSFFGYAPTPGMVGRLIPKIARIVPTRSLRPIPTPVASPAADSESTFDDDLAELAAMGYEDATAAAWRAQATEARRRRDFHLGRVLLAQSRAGEAIPLFESAAAGDPNADPYASRCWLLLPTRHSRRSPRPFSRSPKAGIPKRRSTSARHVPATEWSLRWMPWWVTHI